MQLNIKHQFFLFLLLLFSVSAFSQETLTLQKAIESAQQNNRGIQIKNLQKKEKLEKIEQDKIKRLPSVTINSTYQYNVNTGQLTIDKGSFGSLPLSPTTIIALPNEDKSFDLGKHHTFNAGAMIYQPITQQKKIKTGIEISENEVRITDVESRKISLQIQEGVQKLYYGLLINQERTKEQKANLEVEKIKLYDVESALLAGKTIALSREGMQASIADREQEILKLEIEADNYISDLRNLTQLPVENYILDDNTQFSEDFSQGNPDEELAKLNLEKAKLAIKATKESNLPDVGIIGGYSYQVGNMIYPKHNPFIGINLKWNLQDVLTNKSLEKQRTYLVQQAEQNILMTQENIANETEKATRKIEQFQKLITVAQKAVNYRKGELKVEIDKKAAGLNTKVDILKVQAGLAKAQADLYAAQLGYELANSDLKRISGK